PDRELPHHGAAGDGVDRGTVGGVPGDPLCDRLVHVVEAVGALVQVVAGDHLAPLGELGGGRMVDGPHHQRVGGVFEEPAVGRGEPGEVPRPQPGDDQPPLVVDGAVVAGADVSGVGAWLSVPGGCTIGWGSTTHVPYSSLTVTSASRNLSISHSSSATILSCSRSCSRS